MRWLYSLVLQCLQPWVRRKLRRRALAEPRYGADIGQRFGVYTAADPAPPPTPDAASGPPLRIWIHAVSLGETRAAAILLAALRARFPQLQLVLTHGTATGWEQGQALLQAGDMQVWQPWDTPAAVDAFLQRFQPSVGLLLETEVWPNWVARCQARRMPLYLVNARLSAKSLHKAQRLSWLARPAFASLAGVWAQTPADAGRLGQLGAPLRGVTGNLKFDAQPDARQLARAADWRSHLDRPVVLFASSREGEEQMFLAALATLPSARRMRVQWLLVPRHPQRFDSVATLLANAGFTVSRRRSWADAPHSADIWLGDSLGEMALYYGLADIALLGGSFAPLGGQNLIESAACSCPVLLGPHTFNFAEAAEQAIAHGAAQRLATMADAVARAVGYVADRDTLQHMRAQALAWSQSHRGAAERTVQALVDAAPALFKTAPPSPGAAGSGG